MGDDSWRVDTPRCITSSLQRLRGICATEATRLVASGRVSINGIRVVRDTLLYPEDLLVVDGVAMPSSPSELPVPARIWAFCKAAGVTTDASPGTPMRAAADEMAAARSAVVGDDAEVHGAPQPQPIGQLDKNTTGLLLFTDDGRVANWICLPGTVPKTYEATFIAPAGRAPTEAQRRAVLHDGVDVTRSGKRKRIGRGDGGREVVRFDRFDLVDEQVIVAAASAPGAARGRPQLASATSSSSSNRAMHTGGAAAAAAAWPAKTRYRMRATLRCGLNHVVKRVMHNVGLPPIVSLHRAAVGGLTLGPPLAAGEEEPTVAGEEGGCVVRPAVGGFVELTPAQRTLVGAPSPRDLAALRRCQLLCRYRSALDKEDEAEEGGEEQGEGCGGSAGDGDEGSRLMETARLGRWLREHHSLRGACFAAFPHLTCRGNAAATHAKRW